MEKTKNKKRPTLSFADIEDIKTVKVSPTTLGLVKCKELLARMQRYVEEIGV